MFWDPSRVGMVSSILIPPSSSAVVEKAVNEIAVGLVLTQREKERDSGH